MKVNQERHTSHEREARSKIAAEAKREKGWLNRHTKSSERKPAYPDAICVENILASWFGHLE